jgi:hypothetical protein
MKNLIAVLTLAVSAAACAQCGVERNDVKDLKDAAAKEIHMTPEPMTIAALRTIKPPAKIGNLLPRLPGERQVYELEAQIIGYKYEAFDPIKKTGDRDYHVVLSTIGKPAETMIIEIPHPDCGPPEYKQLFAQLRAFVDAQAKAQAPRHTPGPTFFTFPKPVPVTVGGVTFFDKIHGTHKNLDGTIGQVGVAPNGIELHPTLKLNPK